MSPAPDGRHVAVGVAGGGSERSLVHIVDVESGTATIENTVPFVGGAFNWRDTTSFYYLRTVSTSETRVDTTFLHRIGTNMEHDDVAIVGVGIASAIPQDPIQQVVITAVPPRWAIAEATHGVESDQDEVYVAPLASVDSSSAPWRKITTASDEVEGVAATGNLLYGLTSKGAPLRRVFRTSLDRVSPL
jgi:prolyl oligopeptidase